MSFLGNVLWFLLGGLAISLIYFVIGILMCITIVGVPFGIQLFKFGILTLQPFGRNVVNSKSDTGCLSIIMNIIWLLLGWWEIACMHLVLGLICCITIIGIPFGKQHFKMVKLSFLPFGKTIS